MPSRIPCPRRLLLAACALGAALSVHAQSGLRLNPGPLGLDPAFAGGWLAPERYPFGYFAGHWREAIGFAPSQRLHWTYEFGERASLGLSYTGERAFYYPAQGPETAGFTLIGRYWLAPEWAVSAEAGSPAGSLRLNDVRIGVRRRF
jgi:hypothetical protein